MLPGQVDQALHILRATTPILKARKGFIHLALIPNHTLSQITVISLWMTKAHALASEASRAYRAQARKLEPFLDQSGREAVDIIGIQAQTYRQMLLN